MERQLALGRFSVQEQQRIRAALEYATACHASQRRISGEPYISHPVGVAGILMAEFNADADTVIAALLHDTVEDTGVSLDEIGVRFGPAVRRMVDALTNVGEGDGQPKLLDWYVRHAKSWKKLERIGADDPRVYLVRIADRWHNLQSCGAMRPFSQFRLADDTLQRHVPLCRRLGFARQAQEIEGLCSGIKAKWSS